MHSAPLLPLAFCAVSLGCSAAVSGSPESADAESSGPSAAVVVVERTVSASDAHASAVARFVRMRSGAVDEDALRMVGAAVDFPALGTCAVAPSAGASGSARAVELLDVGTISLEVNGLQTNLEARLLPDIVDLISGVVYATPATEAEALPARGAYTLRATGSLELDVQPFVVSARAPDEPTLVQVAQVHVAEARDQGTTDEGAGASVTLAAGADVEITWEAGSLDDLVYVDIAGNPDHASNQASTRCLFADVGRATLSNTTLAEALPDPLPDVSGATAGRAEGMLTVHRLHRETFRVRGIEAGEVRFDFARAIPFARR
jgi:hypothetical protein